jgi:hypothetical protein
LGQAGWKDVFSCPDYTERQQEYENRFNTGSIYAPPLIVNGKSEFVGSNEFKLRDAIEGALTRVSNNSKDSLLLRASCKNQQQLK